MKSRVVFADEVVKAAYEQLKTSGAEDRNLRKWLDRAFDALAENAFRGVQIPKRIIPQKYICDYGIDDLWKYDLPHAWRLLYSVARDEVLIVSIILEWLPHKEYERRFNYSSCGNGLAKLDAPSHESCGP